MVPIVMYAIIPCTVDSPKPTHLDLRNGSSPAPKPYLLSVMGLFKLLYAPQLELQR